MVRQILGGIAGYVTMFVVVFVTFTIAYLGMGTDGAFEAGSYNVTMQWIIVSTILGFIAAVAGGYIASVIGGGPAVKITAAIVLIMGVLVFVMTAMAPEAPATRSAEVSNLEAMGQAQTPLWVAAINPIIGIIGALIGGSLHKGKRIN